MQKGAYGIIGAIFPWLLCLAGPSAVAQSVGDTAKPVILGNTQQSTTPLARTGKLFYDFIRPNKEGVRPTLLYSSDDRLYAGANYHGFSQNWRPDSTGQKHKAYLHYSFVQRAMSVGYQGIYNNIIGEWNLFAEASYDWVKWTNFSGLGNDTRQDNPDNDYYRIRSREGFVGLGFQHRLGRQSTVTVTPFYQRIQFLKDEDRYLAQSEFDTKTQDVYDQKAFVGANADVLVRQLDDLLLPTKGYTLSVGVAHTKSLGQARSFTNYSTAGRLYIPFLQKFVFSMEHGAATVKGRPEFFQLNSIGGNLLRGYRRERFWGQTAYYNNNELYYLFNAPWKAFRGKMGFVAFADQGRVWLDGEKSNTWHCGYGGGIVLVPHNKVYLSAQYGMSKDRKGFHFTFRRRLQ